jgi:hypothetical protein
MQEVVLSRLGQNCHVDMSPAHPQAPLLQPLLVRDGLRWACSEDSLDPLLDLLDQHKIPYRKLDRYADCHLPVGE